MDFDGLFIAFMKQRFETIQAAKDWLSLIVQEGQVYQWIKHTVRDIDRDINQIIYAKHGRSKADTTCIDSRALYC
jgi:hypothetical protein